MRAGSRTLCAASVPAGTGAPCPRQACFTVCVLHTSLTPRVPRAPVGIIVVVVQRPPLPAELPPAQLSAEKTGEEGKHVRQASRRCCCSLCVCRGTRRRRGRLRTPGHTGLRLSGSKRPRLPVMVRRHPVQRGDSSFHPSVVLSWLPRRGSLGRRSPSRWECCAGLRP